MLALSAKLCSGSGNMLPGFGVQEVGFVYGLGVYMRCRVLGSGFRGLRARTEIGQKLCDRPMHRLSSPLSEDSRVLTCQLRERMGNRWRAKTDAR